MILTSQPNLCLLRPQAPEHRPWDPAEGNLNLELDNELDLDDELDFEEEVWKFTLEGLLQRPNLHWPVTVLIVLIRNRSGKYLASILALPVFGLFYLTPLNVKATLILTCKSWNLIIKVGLHM